MGDFPEIIQIIYRISCALQFIHYEFLPFFLLPFLHPAVPRPMPPYENQLSRIVIIKMERTLTAEAVRPEALDGRGILGIREQ